MTEEQRSELVALLRKPPPEDPKVAFGTLHPYLKGMASPPTALQALRVAFPKPKCRAALDGDPWRWWELLGLYYLDLGPSRWHDAFGIFAALYDYMHAAQRKLGRLHKGMPLCWMADCSYYLNHPFHARRYLVLTLCEDALSRAQDSDHDMGGSYWRLVMRDGVADGDYRACVREIGALSREDPESCAFAEWALQRLERSKWLTRPRARHTGWLSVTPSVMEAGLYRANPRYIRYLRKRGSDARSLSE